MNITRARHVLASPHLPWTPQVIAALAGAYIDHTQAIVLLKATLDELEKEAADMHNRLIVQEEELQEARAILRRLYP